MRRVTLPNASMDAPNVVLGLMRIAEKTDDEIRALMGAARDAGIDFFDHADVYGTRMHECEERFAQALKLTPSERQQIVLQSKAGIVREGPYFDFSYERIVSEVEGSLAALNTDYLDILLLHRPDALVEPEEVARAFDDLHAAGKVLHFGVSNHTPGQIELLKTAVRQPIVANQLQLSITHATLVAQGVAANMQSTEQSIVRDGGGLVEYCRMNGITIQAWSPFQGIWFDGPLFDRERFPELNEVIDRLAAQYRVEPEAISTAWITRHSANMQVILGSTNPQRVAASVAGSDIPLTRAEWYELFRAAGWMVP